jgi:hypothetical protein
MTKKMKTRKQLAAAAGEKRPGTAVKQEPGVSALADARLTRRRSSGWDPYEVWRTRVKGEDDQTPADDAEATPAA